MHCGSAAASAAASAASAIAADPVATKRRICNASARYRKKKQNELETLRHQYLTVFAENRRLAERVEELEEANRALHVRLSHYEPPA